jgi:hypothetical protein
MPLPIGMPIKPLVQRVKKTTVPGKFSAANFRHKKHSKAALVLVLRVTGRRVSGDVATPVAPLEIRIPPLFGRNAAYRYPFEFPGNGVSERTAPALVRATW